MKTMNVLFLGVSMLLGLTACGGRSESAATPAPTAAHNNSVKRLA